MTAAAVDCLCNYTFPGNVRELANLIERLVVLTATPQIGIEDLPAAVRVAEEIPCRLTSEDEWNLTNVVQGVEKQMIMRALKACGSQRKAAKLLGIDHSTLSRKIKRFHPSNVAIMQTVE